MLHVSLEKKLKDHFYSGSSRNTKKKKTTIQLCKAEVAAI